MTLEELMDKLLALDLTSEVLKSEIWVEVPDDLASTDIDAAATGAYLAPDGRTIIRTNDK